MQCAPGFNSDPPSLARRPLLVAEGEADDAAGAPVLLVLIGAALEKETVFLTGKLGEVEENYVFTDLVVSSASVWKRRRNGRVRPGNGKGQRKIHPNATGSSISPTAYCPPRNGFRLVLLVHQVEVPPAETPNVLGVQVPDVRVVLRG